jgi:thiamine kinase-like enzyme
MEDIMDKGLIQSLFNDKVTHIQRLEKGLTNKNYKVIVSDETFVVRIPYADSEHVVNYTNEKKALALVSGYDIDVETVYFDEATGIKITRYIDGFKSFNEYPHVSKYQQVGHLMRKFHTIDTLSNHEFNPLTTLETYQQYVKKPIISFKDAQPFIDFVKAKRQVRTLCHNDWVNDNICFHPQRVYLLDYEYAGDNDPLFDVTSFLSENKITDPAHRDAFLTAYFNEPPSKELQKTLRYWEGFHDVLWGTWAIMMHESRNQKVFLDIAYDKKHAFERILSLL